MEESSSTPTAPSSDISAPSTSAFQVLSETTDPDSLTAEQMEELYASTLDQVKDGEIINGTVVRMEGDYILIDVGYKSEGLVSRHEFPNGGRNLSPDDEVEVYVEERENEDGFMVLSKEKANRIKVWDEI
ncbi:MAG: S1 RNA-binding domain-containing protein, partial [Nitrospinota bacterium]|nr:S1 RNA-binding domain-containing protein [Nitrospinota bacterium]